MCINNKLLFTGGSWTCSVLLLIWIWFSITLQNISFHYFHVCKQQITYWRLLNMLFIINLTLIFTLQIFHSFYYSSMCINNNKLLLTGGCSSLLIWVWFSLYKIFHFIISMCVNNKLLTGGSWTCSSFLIWVWVWFSLYKIFHFSIW